MGELNVPYISQILGGALSHNNDCGPTSALMVAQAYNLATKMTVDQVYDAMQPAGDTAIAAGQLQRWLASQGLKNIWKVGLLLHDLFDVLAERKPCILLIHYAPMVDAGITEKKTFRGAHFIVATGLDIEYAWIHDPYRTDWSGCHQPVKLSVFHDAWTQANLDGNPTCCALIPEVGICDLSVKENVPLEYIVNKPGIIIRAAASQYSTLVRYAWQGEVLQLKTIMPTNGYVPLVAGGWAFLEYLKPKEA